eukprot:8399991-Pyramimonas_sp.AAC.1
MDAQACSSSGGPKIKAIRFSGARASVSALAKICSLAKEDALPSISRRGDVRRARGLELEGATPRGPPLVDLRLQLSKGGNPRSKLRVHCQICIELANVFIA